MGRKERRLVQKLQSSQAKAFFSKAAEAPEVPHLEGKNKRLSIARLCSEILACPELNHAKFKVLLKLTGDPEVQALVLTSLCALFIDIAPGYAIKTGSQEGKMFSREVRALKTYEALILGYYGEYLAILKDFAKSNLGGIKCICRLVRKLPHFNFTKDLIVFLARQVNYAPDAVLEAFSEVLRSNEFEMRYQVVKQLHHWMKATSYKKIPADIIEILSSLDLTVLEVDKPKKKQRMEAEVERDLEEAMATVKTEDLAKSNMKILKEILDIYFRIIKLYPQSHLFPAVLKGISRYAEYINTDFMRDLVVHLGALLADEQLPPEHNLQAIHAVLRITKSSAGVLLIEDRMLGIALYKAMLHVPTTQSHAESLLTSLTFLLLNKRQYSADLVMAFAKRMLQIAYHCSRPLMKAIIYFLKVLVNTYPKLASRMQDEDEETSYSAGYVWDAEDPSLVQANDFHWELKALAELEPKLVKSLLQKNWSDDLSKTPVKFYQTMLLEAEQSQGQN
mmetsp:Transcript_19944/g.36887  ORF Transcript_19944/g.36887 Transcript_19944/m.36887 type:complete len:506 (-) Transcript_19944:3187-4704(-)